MPYVSAPQLYVPQPQGPTESWVAALDAHSSRRQERDPRNSQKVRAGGHLFFFLAAPSHLEFLCQGSDLSSSCDLFHSYSHARSFNSLCQAGYLTCPGAAKDAVDPVVPQQELLGGYL